MLHKRGKERKRTHSLSHSDRRKQDMIEEGSFSLPWFSFLFLLEKKNSFQTTSLGHRSKMTYHGDLFLFLRIDINTLSELPFWKEPSHPNMIVTQSVSRKWSTMIAIYKSNWSAGHNEKWEEDSDSDCHEEIKMQSHDVSHSVIDLVYDKSRKRLDSSDSSLLLLIHLRFLNRLWLFQNDFWFTEARTQCLPSRRGWWCYGKG